MKAICSFVNRLNAWQKLLISLVLGTAAVGLPVGGPWLLSVVAGWDVFCLLLLTLWWITFFTTPVTGIRSESAKQDESRYVVYALVLGATYVSILAVLILLTSRNVVQARSYLPLLLSLGCMVLSWLLLHTTYALRYAHLFYADDSEDTGTPAGGLIFPGESQPDFIDFAYFSFILGMTFQVSDVSISSRPMRRLALWHSLLSFAYNATIVALTVNVIAGLRG